MSIDEEQTQVVSDLILEPAVVTKPCWVFNENNHFDHESFAQSNVKVQEDHPDYWIKPISSTFVEPEMKSGFWPIWEEDHWTLVEDNRGPVYDSEKNSISTYDTLGKLPSNLSKTVPDTKSFMSALNSGTLLSIITTNKLLSSYTTLETQLTAFNWTNATLLLKDAVESKLLTEKELTALKTAIGKYGLPIKL